MAKKRVRSKNQNRKIHGVDKHSDNTYALESSRLAKSAQNNEPLNTDSFTSYRIGRVYFPTIKRNWGESVSKWRLKAFQLQVFGSDFSKSLGNRQLQMLIKLT